MGSGWQAAPNAERPDAQFHFSVRQVEFNEQSRTGGFFAIEACSGESRVVHPYPEVQRLEWTCENKAPSSVVLQLLCIARARALSARVA
jgi:hypothetical protein